MKQSSAASKHNDGIRTRILIMIGVLTLVCVAAVPRVLARWQSTDVLATRATVSAMAEALEQFSRDHHGRYPGTGDSIRVLTDDSGSRSSGWNGPYLDQTPLDAWGNEFLYWCPGTFNRQSFDLSSAGPDGVLGNADDINNWDD